MVFPNKHKGALQHKPGKGGAKDGAKKKKNKLSSIKNQIRGVERLLKKPDLDPKARVKQEARLAELRASSEAHARSELERKYAIRYHKVRFFERVKLERRLRKLQARAAAAAAGGGEGEGEDGEALRREVECAQADLQYVLHFPKAEKYVSLLKDSEDPEEQARLDSERLRLRALVVREMAEAALVAEADEGRSLAAAPAVAAAAADRAPPSRGGADEKEAEAGMSDSDDFFLHSGDEEEGSDEGGAPAAAAARPAATGAEQRQEGPQGVAGASDGNDDGDGSSDHSSSGGSDVDDGDAGGVPQRRQEGGGRREPPGNAAPKPPRAQALAPRDQGRQHRGGRGGGQHAAGRPRQPFSPAGRGPGSGARGGGAGYAGKPLHAGGGRGGRPAGAAPRGGGGGGVRKPPMKAAAAKPKPAPAKPAEKLPLRPRAEGGRKRRKK